MTHAFRRSLMPSFRQLSASFPALLIDAASSVVQVAALLPDGRMEWQTATAEAGIGIFEAVAQLQTLDPGRATTFIYCDGPGSILGIRTAAMALRTWCVLQPRPIFAYSSLAVVAHALNRPDLAIIADARRDTWHHYQLGRGLRRIATVDLTGELLMPEGFRQWSALPRPVGTTRYHLTELLPRVWEADLLRATDAPDAFLHEEPSYVTWTPRIHRASP